ncbi:winged helix-turn-helix transcriptional regulator [Candidatus Woesearchaeota archaeon]|jgi:sugar-specific transcriptional regulator TrmB|nr:winged helix-turn-helix transcriptional regulator [Candidatus Woesearchaeota archaeon]MBT4110986.1 winged helix-turn-helix transcriptional regulator [Candidatus Woesearchaeota archaeon]MBT4336855.1 winged helix-turn-helix transcriptional regulator [Candidatus Woesearchaeota archaeon]MBT4469830.1 winged helix-turn-helix transcriptional regulator [Candidatus Woesearchaeota archaeon]MBT6743699.1 winged helix-turn-helix transcriptional regulator [Candidatus Woesearchaeota archaeon]
MYEAELKELGLTENEIKVYLILLENGILNPSHIAQKTGLHRSYVYDTLERLIDRGIINTVLVNNKKHYQPVDPKALRQSFELKLMKIDEILPKLSGLFKSTQEETKVELHKGKRVYRTLIKDLTANLKKNDVVYLLGADEKILETVEPIYLKQYLTIIKNKNVKERIIVRKGTKKLKEKNIEYKELDKQYFDETTIVIHQNKTYIFIWGNPYHLIVIENKKVASTYLKQFDLLWDIAK